MPNAGFDQALVRTRKLAVLSRLSNTERISDVSDHCSCVHCLSRPRSAAGTQFWQNEPSAQARQAERRGEEWQLDDVIFAQAIALEVSAIASQMFPQHPPTANSQQLPPSEMLQSDKCS